MEDQREVNLVVGYYNYADLQALEGYLQGTGITILSAAQDAQRVFDDAVRLEADAVLLCPQVSGYRREFIDDLLYHTSLERSVPTIGWVDAQSDDGRTMVANGAKGYVTMPMDGAQGNKVVQFIHQAIEQVKREDRGEIAAVRPVAASASQSWQRKAVVPWISKGGGSTRTTLAVNLAVALSHSKLGNMPTVILDMDMTKADAHTMLGFTTNLTRARQQGLPLLERGLYDLLLRLSEVWETRGRSAITPRLLDHYTVPCMPDKAQLALLPGLFNPAHADSTIFRDRQLIYDIGKQIIDVMTQKYAFVILDIGQDMTQPLHRAAIEAADEVVVTVPPQRTAVTDVANALPALGRHFGDLSKFKLVITSYDDAFGMTEKEIITEVGLPKLTTIPHDAEVASVSINEGVPFVLTDNGPLGEAVRGLAGIYLPSMAGRGRTGKGLGGVMDGLKRALVREA
jgi:Flp pilus assembly CpaE family ATPase